MTLMDDMKCSGVLWSDANCSTLTVPNTFGALHKKYKCIYKNQYTLKELATVGTIVD